MTLWAIALLPSLVLPGEHAQVLEAMVAMVVSGRRRGRRGVGVMRRRRRTRGHRGGGGRRRAVVAQHVKHVPQLVVSRGRGVGGVRRGGGGLRGVVRVEGGRVAELKARGLAVALLLPVPHGGRGGGRAVG